MRRDRIPLLSLTQTLYPAYTATPVHRLIAHKLEDFLLKVEAGLAPRLMITIPPRNGKSELGSVHFPAWVLGEQPDWPIIHVSYTADLSNGFSRRVRNIIKSPEYQTMYPGIHLASDSRSVAYWNLEHPHRGCFTSAGVGGPITGRGGKIVIIDDPVKNRQDADSEVFRQMQRDWYGSTLYTRLEGAGAGIVLIMTRWHTDDLGGYVTQGAGAEEVPEDAHRWEILNIPALCEDPNTDPLSRKVGDPIWPEKFPVSYLDNIRGTLPQRDWLALYQQRPVAAEGNLLHCPKIHDSGGLIPRNLVILQGWDLAISEKNTADFTVGFTVGIEQGTGNLWLLDVSRYRGDFNVTVAKIQEQWEKWNAVAVGIESVSFQAAILQEVRRRHATIPLCEIKVTRDKVSRATALADRIDSGKVYANKNAPWWRDFESEALAFPNGSFDDQVDAISVALETFQKMKQWRVA